MTHDFELDADPSDLTDYMLRRDLRQVILSSLISPQGIRVRIEIMNNDGVVIDGHNDKPIISEMTLYGTSSKIDIERIFAAERKMLEWSQEKRREEFARQSLMRAGL